MFILSFFFALFLLTNTREHSVHDSSFGRRRRYVRGTDENFKGTGNNQAGFGKGGERGGHVFAALNFKPLTEGKHALFIGGERLETELVGA